MPPTWNKDTTWCLAPEPIVHQVPLCPSVQAPALDRGTWTTCLEFRLVNDFAGRVVSLRVSNVYLVSFLDIYIYIYDNVIHI